ncbi:hypothetical protein ACS0TY_001567 [Phlomoides rotata]
MSLLLNPHPSSALLCFKSCNFHPKSTKLNSLSFSPNPRRIFSARSSSEPEKPAFVDEWGEKSEPDPEPDTRFSDPDPPKGDDEWGADMGNGIPVSDGGDKLWELKRALVDTVYGSDLGYRASAEVRAETLELVSQLEAANPTPAPTECPDLLDGNWILVYTAFSELLPLLATGSIPLVKVEKITQSIDSSSLNIENSVTLSTPISTISFSASASFQVRTSSRIQVCFCFCFSYKIMAPKIENVIWVVLQVEFKEGKFNPPEIKSRLDLPPSVSIFGQTLSLSAVEESLRPLEGVVEGIARAVSGQPPLKIRIPGEGSKSWLLTTYLDKDFRISRGDGGLFVLAKEGSPLLD